ncbi:hypothetical protein DOTSEDRAFT_70714 [Dothistroma septosporum NZE10]|uniref:Uncharacterized protein n=1 Tax=Dothistroma septosporum (strain NZE10 / CBS 128990) TaxID=675120 RepID=N1PX87_DOTSN|nr:hypothetical protein DOTSEDRAFT_70714 [Dothistroma septosporum NZE10]
MDSRRAISSLSVSKYGVMVDEKSVDILLSGDNPDAAVNKVRADSFCSGDFDMTEEELDELVPPKPAQLPAIQAPKPMPPPPMPARATKKVQTRAPPRPRTIMMKPHSAIKGPFLPASSLYCSPDFGFTSTQLESFIDDDIQLSQAVRG